MTMQEFENLTGVTVTVEDFEKIEYVYMKCDAFLTKQHIVDYYKAYGMESILTVYDNLKFNEDKLRNKIKNMKKPQLKVFRCVVDDGEDAFVTYTTASSKEEIIDVYGGNGEFLKIEDVTAKVVIKKENIAKLLKEAGLNKMQVSLISGLIEQHNEFIKF